MKTLNKYTIVFMLSTLMVNCIIAQEPKNEKPNFLVIVADDMGFSDLGSFGGEINTPNLDKLALEGVRYTNFYVAPTCSPTRSMLLTGIDNHLVGLGNMYEYTAPNQLHEKGYEGHLNKDAPTIAEILKENGYHTYMTGKWHLGKGKENIPEAKGFERSFSMLSGSGSYYSLNGPDEDATPNHFNEDGKYLDELPKGYYATTTFTDKILEYIDSNKNDGKPFFAYLAHQAPHDPLMAPDKYLRKYKGVFDKGWDVLRDDRLKKMVEMGILSEKIEMGERLWYVPGFDKLKPLTQVVTARKMEVYAAVLDCMDMEIGRLLKYLEDNDLRKNTYIIFFSDNGPDVNDKAATYKNYPATAAANWMAKTYLHGFENWGRAESFTAYGPSWAQVSCTPFFGFKYTTYEGGIRSPLIVVPPTKTNSGTINMDAILHVKDIAPTFLELAGIRQSNANSSSLKIQGKSWASMIAGKETSPRRTGDWQLFNLKDDPGERNDIAQKHPEKLRELKSDWDDYVKTNHVI